SGDSVGPAVHRGSRSLARSKYRRHVSGAARVRGGESKAGGVCGVVISVWRYGSLAKGRDDDAGAAVALCAAEAGRGVLLERVLTVFWAGDGSAALLQR